MRSLRAPALAVLLAAMFATLLRPGLHASDAGSSSAEEKCATLIVCNASDAESLSLAETYREARGIPPGNVLSLPFSSTEEISRKEYDEQIALPLRRELEGRGFWKVTRDLLNRPIVYASSVRYVALIRGIPLKIRQETSPYPGDGVAQPPPYGGINAASVDSEIAVLGLFTPQISGILGNPMAGAAPGAPVPPWLLMVSRLDASSAEEVRVLISSTMRAEREGLRGWGYIDLRSTREKGYVLGEAWITRAWEAMNRSGIPVIADDLPETLQAGFPVTDAAAYYGWYAENLDGPFAERDFRFVPGAVAVHLHSFSASTLRSRTRGWAAPLISLGACASLGNVYEPYLPFTADLGKFCESLLGGMTLAESHVRSLSALSWMNVCLGDPLYRPYAWFFRERGEGGDSWSSYRSIILAHGGDVLASAGDLERLSRSVGTPMPLEALGNALLARGLQEKAGIAFREALGLAKEKRIRFRLLIEECRCLERLHETKEALSDLDQAGREAVTPPEKNLLSIWRERLRHSDR